jgi:hypothetical protein
MIEPWKRGDLSMRGRGGSRASIRTWVVQRVGECSREQSAYFSDWGNFSFARTKDGAIWFWGERDGARGLLGVNAQQRAPAKVPMEKLLPL